MFAQKTCVALSTYMQVVRQREIPCYIKSGLALNLQLSAAPTMLLIRVVIQRPAATFPCVLLQDVCLSMTARRMDWEVGGAFLFRWLPYFLLPILQFLFFQQAHLAETYLRKSIQLCPILAICMSQFVY